jgi:hypothetical protein
MMKIIINHTALAVMLSVGLAYTNTSFAHAEANFLSAPADAVDVFQTTCSGASAKLLVQVNATKTGPVVNVQVIKGTSAAHATDPASKTVKSPAAVVSGKVGVYTILVDKNSAGRADYSLDAHCEAANGTHTTQSEPVLKQNK